MPPVGLIKTSVSALALCHTAAVSVSVISSDIITMLLLFSLTALRVFLFVFFPRRLPFVHLIITHLSA